MAKKPKKPAVERYRTVRRIEVYVWDQFVGAVALDPALGYYVFAYDKEFGRSGIQLAPLHMPADDSEKLYVFADLPEATYQRLPAMLADALPDEFGNALIDKYLAEKGLPKSRISALDRLAYMGKRAMGTFEFKPARGPQTKIPNALEMGQLVAMARKVVTGNLEGDSAAEAALRSIIEVGTSANGARAKAVIGWNRKTSEIRSGQFDLLPGFEHWLLKFDGMGKDRELGLSQDFGRVEYAYYLMAKQSGIDIPESRLLMENDRAHFMTRRFDREDDGTKHHLQSLCAIDHLDFKKKSANSYEQLFMAMRQLKLGRSAEVEAFRRMALNVMGRNCDDHTKNFSFLLRKGGSWEFSPAYDITFAHNPESEWTNQHLMSVNGKFGEITWDDCLALANRFGIGEAPSILKQVRQTVEEWPVFAKKAGVQPSEIRRIRAQLRLI
ncbi:MAG: phosphatidylinositol kinase [Elusimicrobia bacterium RIFCSPHIGHO2_02_FULL_57_9]|nr:MAG: phosphatidylinositol kinase [Elusimicrobia bacterium RIFCSPHIGHO2_02_FULL_57_9]